MPELPEVEVLRRSLEPHLLGERFAGVAVRFPRLREPIPTRTLRRRLPGRRVLAVRRRSKYLLVEIEGNSTLVVHLGMSGRLTLRSSDAPHELHEHVVLGLTSGAELRFRDPRRFGLILVLPTDRVAHDRHFVHLGVEPVAVSAEVTGAGHHTFDGAYLSARARGRHGPVKAFLMDARIVVGVGNIYASESLFRAGVHPSRSVSRISAARWWRLAHSVREVLDQAIEEGGTTLNDFADAAGEPGYFQVSLSVYGREGEACMRCGGTVRRLVQGNRSTFYCPRCQR